MKLNLVSSVFLPIFFILLSEVLGVEYVDYRVVPAEAHGRRFVREVNPKCIRPGLICDGCKDILLCDNNNESSLLWSCPGEETCNNGMCSMTTSVICSPLAIATFTCTSIGVFPDPGDCFKYHFCIENITTEGAKMVDIPNYCRSFTEGIFYSYNAQTTYCDKKLPFEYCPSHPVPLCTFPGQTAALSENPSMYYICKLYVNTPSIAGLVLYPFLYICENGKYYNGRYQCE